MSRKLVPFVAKKIYPEENLKKHIEIDVRSTQPITITIHQEIPAIYVYIKIINKSPYLDVEFDRGNFSLWLRSESGIQPLGDFTIMSRAFVGTGETKEIYCKKELNEFQVKFIQRIKDNKEVTASLQSFRSWFNSSLYPSVIIEHNLENKPCKIES